MTDNDASKILEGAWPGWKLVRLIGEGSYGKVYEIQKTDFGEAFSAAMKVISIPNDNNGLGSYRSSMSDNDVTAYYESVAESLMKEYHIMAKLKGNSNIVSYEDHIRIPREDGVGWIILIRMELLTALNLYVNNNGISRQDVVKLGIAICNALELCKKHKVIHRDIKPENIFISEFGNYKLGDFGVARTLEGTQGLLSKQGTSMYMAPEIYANRPYGATVDIYSLGLVMYQYLNGNKAPFIAEKLTYKTQIEALSRRMNGEALPLPSGEHGRLAEIVLKACSYDPAERYSDPVEMRKALEALVDIADRKNYIYPHDMPPVPTLQVRFLDTEGDVIKCRSYFESEPVEIPEVPDEIEKDGDIYVFEGWPPQVKPNVTEDVDYKACYHKEQLAVQEPELKESGNRRKRLVFAAAAAAAVILLVVLLATTLSQTQGTQKGLISTLAGSAEWSEWAFELPDDINSQDYIIETKTQYRSAPLYSSSSDDAKNDYTLCYTKYGDYGDWSEWQDEEIVSSDSKEVETKTLYSYQKLMSKLVTDAARLATSTSYYWSQWMYSDSPVAASSTVRVNETQQYRYRERAIIYCFCKNSDWSEFSDTPLSPSDTLAVNTRLMYRYMSRTDGEDKPTPSMDNFRGETADYTGRFIDVDEDEWYGGSKSDCIGTAVEINAISADEYMAFRPDDNLTIAEAIKAAVIINRIYNGEQGVLLETNEWYQVYIDYAVQNGMIKKDEFSDYNADATRAEAAYILMKSLPWTELPSANIVTSITDMDINSPYYKSAYLLAQAGVISWPSPEFSFRPDALITRAEAATFVERLVRPENRIVNG